MLTEKLYNRTSYMSLFTPHPGGKKQNYVFNQPWITKFCGMLQVDEV